MDTRKLALSTLTQMEHDILNEKTTQIVTPRVIKCSAQTVFSRAGSLSLFMIRTSVNLAFSSFFDLLLLIMLRIPPIRENVDHFLSLNHVWLTYLLRFLYRKVSA